MADTAPAKPTEAVVPETKAPEAAPAADASAAPPAESAAATTVAPAAEALAPAPAATEAPAAAPTATEEKPGEAPAAAPKEPEDKPGEAAPAAAEAAVEPVAASEGPAPAEPAVVAAAPTEEKVAAPAGTPNWPDPDPSTPLGKFLAEIPAILEEADYNEVYGLTIGSSHDFHTKMIAQKFLRANADDIPKAREQLVNTLKWRKEYQPLKAMEEVFSKEKFGGLGYVASLDGVPGEPEGKKTVVTFNLYGAVKDNKATFGDFDSFLRWRVALMELSLQSLNLASATESIPPYSAVGTPAGRDPYQAYQVHDYMNVSFLRQDPHVKAASNRTIETFSKYYPETLSRKFFVNVPVVMGWVFAAMKLLLPRETVRKFTVLTSGKDLVGELGNGTPNVYGGTGGELEGTTITPKVE